MPANRCSEIRPPVRLLQLLRKKESGDHLAVEGSVLSACLPSALPSRGSRQDSHIPVVARRFDVATRDLLVMYSRRPYGSHLHLYPLASLLD